MSDRTVIRRSWRRAWIVLASMAALAAFAPGSAFALSPPAPNQGPVKCVSLSGWCTANAGDVAQHSGWAQATADNNPVCASAPCPPNPNGTVAGYRWTGYGWVPATIRANDRWFWHSYTTGDYSIMRTYDTGVWVAVKKHKVTVWLQESYVKRHFIANGCAASTATIAPPPPPTCYYIPRPILYLPTAR